MLAFYHCIDSISKKPSESLNQFTQQSTEPDRPQPYEPHLLPVYPSIKFPFVLSALFSSVDLLLILVPSMDSPIVKFFEGKRVLVTGFSGYLGKVLVAKLVRSTNVEKVYVLIRDKNGVNYRHRMTRILSSLPFTPDKNANLNYSDRVVPVKGDLTLPDLGISRDELNILKKEISVVFHSAAEVRFNVRLSTNYIHNVEGTANLIKLCRTFVNLRSLVHISSLYAAGNQPLVEEKVQPLEFDYKAIRKCLREDAESIESHLSSVQAKFPNAYTLTKALAESLVEKEIGDIPTAILRPSIVFVALNEPAPGWGDTLQGIQGITISATTGLLQTVDWNYWNRFEIVPVDTCANLAIACAWYMAEQSSAKLKVINFSSGPFHPDWTFGKFFSTAREYAIIYPSSKQLRPLLKPPKIKRASFLFPVQKFIYHTLFAIMVDLILSLFGYKKILYKMATKLNEGLGFTGFFATHQYQIRTENYLEVIESLSPEDQKIFKSDMRDMDFMAHARTVYFGFRKYFLGDNDDNIESSRSKAKLVCFIYRTIQLSLLIILGLSITSIHRYIFT